MTDFTILQMGLVAMLDELNQDAIESLVADLSDSTKRLLIDALEPYLDLKGMLP